MCFTNLCTYICIYTTVSFCIAHTQYVVCMSVCSGVSCAPDSFITHTIAKPFVKKTADKQHQIKKRLILM